jgi:hypothetical protein
MNGGFHGLFMWHYGCERNTRPLNMSQTSRQVPDWEEIEDPEAKLARAGEFKASGNRLFGRGKFRAATKWYAYRCSLQC